VSQHIDDITRAELIEAARKAAEQAYVPYSHFPVGAAVLTSNGQVFSGCNVENASFGLTICAERVAVFTAAAGGHRQIMAIAVSAPGAPGTTPCGACRQVLREFVPSDGMLVLVDGESEIDVVTLAALLPNSFGPDNLDAVR
jgi:cytidine deaminase